MSVLLYVPSVLLYIPPGSPQRAPLLRAIASFLESGGFTRTLAALQSEAQLEVRRDTFIGSSQEGFFYSFIYGWFRWMKYERSHLSLLFVLLDG